MVTAINPRNRFHVCCSAYRKKIEEEEEEVVEKRLCVFSRLYTHLYLSLIVVSAFLWRDKVLLVTLRFSRKVRFLIVYASEYTN